MPTELLQTNCYRGTSCQLRLSTLLPCVPGHSLEPPNLPLPSCPALPPPPLRPPFPAAPPLPLGAPWSPPLPAPLQSQNARWCTPTRTVDQAPAAADGEGAARLVCCAFLNAPLPAAAPSTAGERSKRDPWFKTEDNTMPEDNYRCCVPAVRACGSFRRETGGFV